MRKYLPIGTVVKLKNVDKLTMIAGYFPRSEANNGHVWDYSAFPYPEGMIDNDKIVQFDGEAIEKIIVMGYQDELQMQFIRAVMGKADEIKGQAGQSSEVTD
ncbi:MAG: DUF4176 domain-containing protein [Eubacteriales bacterium]|nr:DUF4176 domain-containing protein [Lachnospiraceae bacterium]MDO5127325.1 DUF4176 domain-containing protein [Eubacteriales bacterium]